MRCLVRLTILSFISLSIALLAWGGQDQQRPMPSPTPALSAPGGMPHFVLDRTLKTPTQPIRGLAFGDRPPTLVALGGDGLLWLWNAATGDLVKAITPAGHPKPVSCMAFSPDGEWIALGEDFTKAEIFTGKVELLDTVAGRDVRALATHHWEVEGLAFSQDGRWLVSSSWDRKVRVMAFPSGNQVREFENPSKPHGVAISPDAKVIASGGMDSTVTLWDRESGKQLYLLSGHSGGISSVAFSPDGKYLASASADGSVRIWNVSTGESSLALWNHVGGVLSAVFSPNGRIVASGGADKTVRLWDASTGKNYETLGAHSSVWQVEFSVDGNYLAAGYADGTINIWMKQK